MTDSDLVARQTESKQAIGHGPAQVSGAEYSKCLPAEVLSS
jgi:hypothetical protein